jgi:hypothetical protein
MNYVYLLRCSDDTLYCGWTTHLQERIAAHNSGSGAKYTRSRLPVQLAYYSVSPQFFGWLAGLGKGIRISWPEDVCEEYKAYLQGIIETI